MTKIYPKFPVVVVDDGSTDNTAQVASSFQGISELVLISHKQNRGLGRAIQTGLEWAVNHARPDEIIITMDADDTHEPGIIPQMVDKIRRGADVVIASRYCGGGEQVGLSPQRRILSWGASKILGSIFNIQGVTDYSSGYRAYRASLLRQAFERYGDDFIQANGFDCMAEILLKLRALNPVAAEVPLVLRYDRKNGESKMAVGATIMRYFGLIRRAAMHKPAPALKRERLED